MQPTAFTCYADELEVDDLIVNPNNWETGIIKAIVKHEDVILVTISLTASEWELALHPDQPVEVLER
jgi:hypothetical protein